MENGRKPSGSEHIADLARTHNTGWIIDRGEIDRARERNGQQNGKHSGIVILEVLMHLPKPLQDGILRGENRVLIDYTGNMAVMTL